MLHLGYQLNYRFVSGLQLGLAQKRARIFLIASARCFPLPEFPVPSHKLDMNAAETTRYRDFMDPPKNFKVGIDYDASYLYPMVRIQDVIADMPELKRLPESFRIDYVHWILHHEYPILPRRDLFEIGIAEQAEDSDSDSDLSDEDSEYYNFKTHRRRKKEQLKWTGVTYAITTKPGHLVHPGQRRPLSVAEIARLHGTGCSVSCKLSI